MLNVLFTKQVVEVLHQHEGQHATIRGRTNFTKYKGWAAITDSKSAFFDNNAKIKMLHNSMFYKLRSEKLTLWDVRLGQKAQYGEWQQWWVLHGTSKSAVKEGNKH